jgi:ketosteroid isomerase-like protein
MKDLFPLSLVVAFLVLGACTQKVDIEAEKAKVKIVFDQLLQVSETEDNELLNKIFAHDPDMVNIGADSAEYVVGWEPLRDAMHKQFASFENTKISARNQVIKVHDSGKVAWVSEIWDVSLVAGGQPVSLKGARFTGVLENRNGNWVIVQTHTSVPVSGQAAQY